MVAGAGSQNDEFHDVTITTTVTAQGVGPRVHRTEHELLSTYSSSARQAEKPLRGPLLFCRSSIGISIRLPVTRQWKFVLRTLGFLS